MHTGSYYEGGRALSKEDLAERLKDIPTPFSSGTVMLNTGYIMSMNDYRLVHVQKPYMYVLDEMLRKWVKNPIYEKNVINFGREAKVPHYSWNNPGLNPRNLAARLDEIERFHTPLPDDYIGMYDTGHVYRKEDFLVDNPPKPLMFLNKDGVLVENPEYGNYMRIMEEDNTNG